jgi:hypothetical protein
MNGQLECLKYARKNGCPWDKYNCTVASGNGQLECLKYAHTHGCPWDKFTCSAAAINGHLDCLIYAHTHGCPWDIHTCSVASFHGHLNCLEYARKNGCPWDKEECLKIAIAFNRKSIINYIKNDKENNEKKDQVDNGSVISSTCEICLINKRCVVYQPCGHVLSCWSCTAKTEECSSCNKKVSNFLKVFFP